MSLRRPLTDAEIAEIRVNLETRWHISGYWYPLDWPDLEAPPPHAVAFDTEPFRDGELERRLQRVLAALGVSRIYELGESQEEIEVSSSTHMGPSTRSSAPTPRSTG